MSISINIPFASGNTLSTARPLLALLQTAKPFERNSEAVDFEESLLLQGKPWLTSLALRYAPDNVEMEFVECVIAINQQKNIVATPMQGYDGTVKEWISNGDFQITVNLGLTNDMGNHTYPIDKLQALERLLSVKDALEIQSDLLDVFSVSSGVISGYGLVQETHSNRQTLQLEMLSDKPYVLTIKRNV